MTAPAAPTATPGLVRARLYRTARTAHLERAAELPPALFLYSARRYDFDEELARRVGARQVGTLAAARMLGRAHVDVLEVNEPASLESARRTAVVLAWLRLRALVSGRRPRVVAYAIENVDPSEAPRGASVRQAVLRRLDRLLARYVWWECDRLAFGTAAAAAVYAQAFGTRRRPLATSILPALPVACPCAQGTPPRGDRVVFLGALVERKGFALLAQAWPHVVAAVPDAQLSVIGKGRLEPLARQLATSPDVRLIVDPPRDRIHAELRSAAVLTLPSQRSGRWREQVGLPIVEGLAHGCTVVTTEETGLAEWLSSHGHRVIAADGDARGLADALVAALHAHPGPEQVRAALPGVDGRVAADRWMFGEG